MPRIFFAVNLTPEIKERLTSLQSRFAGDSGAIKWVKQDNFHLTLHFLGDVAEDKLPHILDGAQKAAGCCPAFTLDIRTTGAFPHPGRPRVIWAGITKGHTQLTQLAEILAKSLSIPLAKPLSPHVTLGRIQEGRLINLSPFLQNETEFNGGALVVDRFACMQSTLTPQGPIYHPIHEFALREKK